MGLVLALLGLVMSAIDFFSFTEKCERAALCLKDSLKVRKRQADALLDSMLRYLAYLCAVVLIAALLAGLAVFIKGSASQGIYLMVVFAGCVVAIWAQLFLGIVVGVLHILSMPRKGIVGSLGLLLALVGVLIEFVR